jgi:hypothetical protein
LSQSALVFPDFHRKKTCILRILHILSSPHWHSPHAFDLP